MNKQDSMDRCLAELRSIRRNLVMNTVLGNSVSYNRYEYRKCLYVLLQIETSADWSRAELDFDERYWVKHPDELEKMYHKYWN